MAAQVDEEENKQKMKVFVAVPRPRYERYAPVALEVSRNDTVESIKATLHHMKGIPPSRQRLVFASSALPDDDDTTLGDHGVVDSATIQLMETKMQVFVRCMHTVNSRTIAINGIESSDTVESFRLRLQERDDTWLRPALQRIICGHSQLEDGHTLADHGVGHCMTVTLLFRPFCFRGRVVDLDIEVTDTVGRIKERVEAAEGVPVPCQSVSYHGKDLDDDRALVDEEGGALELVRIVSRRQEKGDATKITNKRDTELVVRTECVKRGADVNVTCPGIKFVKRKKIENKSLVEAVETVQDVQRRRFRVHLVGPELARICPSSCDTDPFP